MSTLLSILLIVSSTLLGATATEIRYWNLPMEVSEWGAAHMLNLGHIPQVQYPEAANATFMDSDDVPLYINPFGYLTLANNLIENNAPNTTAEKRDDDLYAALAGLLHSSALEVDVDALILAASLPLGSTGTLDAANQTDLRDNAEFCDTSNGFVGFFAAAGGRALDQLASDIAGWVQMGSTKTACVEFLYARYDDTNIANDSHIWLIAGAPWTTGDNCATTASVNTIAEAITESLLDAENRQISSTCTRLTHSGTWHCDVRYMMASLAADCGLKVWDQPCIDY
ncbi:unnamed protein product [[Candida] boidinii]|uniref:Unnamed protein product n=1 Tax=Candida boidinii TaxID=5477 RepID=A0A9W6T922_CANBO|nr:unnamed protein product [[Candida] boidinii]GMG06006.1 unnamed protein product [[Candida] boidinii]